jgi:hypothetical protein
VNEEKDLSPEIKEFIDRLIVPLLVDRCKEVGLFELKQAIVQTGPGVILTHGPAK